MQDPIQSGRGWRSYGAILVWHVLPQRLQSEDARKRGGGRADGGRADGILRDDGVAVGRRAEHGAHGGTGSRREAAMPACMVDECKREFCGVTIRPVLGLKLGTSERSDRTRNNKQKNNMKRYQLFSEYNDAILWGLDLPDAIAQARAALSRAGGAT